MLESDFKGLFLESVLEGIYMRKVSYSQQLKRETE